MDKCAAHFLLLPQLVGSPPNDALISALLEMDYIVDLFVPGGECDVKQYGNRVRLHPVSYGYRWLAENIISPRWLRYSLFSGTTEDPMGVAGSLAKFYRRTCMTLADEIKSGSFRGNRGRRWKELCRFGMRASSLSVVNEMERAEIQRMYAGLSKEHPVIVYPGCFRDPPDSLPSSDVRAARGIPEGALVVCYSGVFSEGNGGMWLTKAVGDAGAHVWFWAQVGGMDELTKSLLRNLRGAQRLVVEQSHMMWRDAWASMGGVDIGIVVYLQNAPQFRHMGTASNRLCMFLAMGVPVIASRQPSFEFIERYDCGVLVENEREFVQGIERVAGRLDDMKGNALRCAREYIDAPGRYEELKRCLSEL